MRGGGARARSQTRKLPLSMSQVALRLISAEPTADSHPQNFGVPVDLAPPPLYHPPTHPKSRPPSEGRPSTARGWACSSGNVLGVGVLERRARGYQLGVCVNRFPFRIAPKLLRWDCGACTKEHLNLRDYRHVPRSGREREDRVSLCLMSENDIGSVTGGGSRRLDETPRRRGRRTACVGAPAWLLMDEEQRWSIQTIFLLFY